jgi:hypothetical protein
LDGPLTFRFILQPAIGVLMAVRDGKKDARNERPPIFWDILTHPSHRTDRLLAAAKAMQRVMLLGLLMDVIYQAIVLRTFYPIEALIIVLLLAFLPYLIARGVVNRILRYRYDRRAVAQAQTPKQP